MFFFKIIIGLLNVYDLFSAAYICLNARKNDPLSIPKIFLFIVVVTFCARDETTTTRLGFSVWNLNKNDDIRNEQKKEKNRQKRHFAFPEKKSTLCLCFARDINPYVLCDRHLFDVKPRTVPPRVTVKRT